MSAPPVPTAVILAAGMGTRMRQPRPEVVLEPAQSTMADIGLKAMIPIAGRPFLDYVLAAIADAGYEQACVVVGHAQEVLRHYYTRTAPPTGIELTFAEQKDARGTADAVAAAEQCVGADHFLMVNSDNYYPASVLASIRLLGEPGLVAFDRRRLLAGGNISPDRLRNYALAFAGADGYLERIVEKPSSEMFASVDSNVLISMNCWRFSHRIFTACRAISPSSRHELELADAVQYATQILDERFRVISSGEAVLDLSNRGDIPHVASKLQHVAVRT
jgi:dTDP-glucose pyrophosphorylase